MAERCGTVAQTGDWMRGIALGIGLALIAGQAFAGSYVVTNAGAEKLSGYDAATIKRNGNAITVWSILIWKHHKVFNGKPIDILMSHDIVDCSNDTISSTYITTYRAKSQEAVDRTPGPGTPEPIVPDTIRSLEEKSLCDASSKPIVHEATMDQVLEVYRSIP